MIETIDKALDLYKQDNGINANCIILNLKQMRELKNILGVPSYSPVTYKGRSVYLNQSQAEAPIRVGYVEEATVVTTPKQPVLPYFEEE